MRTLKDILFIGINLALPYLLVNLLMIIDFSVNGSGMQSEANYEKYKFIWVSVFIICGLLQLFLIFKYLKFNEKVKYILLTLVFLIYCYTCYKYFYN
jgi:hypothetical protein